MEESKEKGRFVGDEGGGREEMGVVAFTGSPLGEQMKWELDE